MREFIESEKESPCSVCQTPTKQISLLFEAPYCSQKCVEIENQNYLNEECRAIARERRFAQVWRELFKENYFEKLF